MAVYEEQARFLVGKYGTAKAAAGHSAWSPAASTVFTPEAVMVLLGLVLLAIIVFVLLRDMLDERDRREQIRVANRGGRDAFFSERDTRDL